MKIKVAFYYNGDEEEAAANEFMQAEMEKAYYAERPSRIVKDAGGTSYFYENGDLWKCIKASGCSKGSAYNIGYYSSTIDKRFVDVIISPQIKMALAVMRMVFL